MAGFFFSGSNVAKLDEKNRFVLPQELRYGLIENGVLEFSIGLGMGGCLTIYKQSDIRKIVEAFSAKQHMPQYQKFFTLFFSTLHPTTCDKIGRTNLPPLLKQAVGIASEIVIAGVLGKIEIWPKELYDKNLQNLLSGEDPTMNLSKLAEEAFSLLNGCEPQRQERNAQERNSPAQAGSHANTHNHVASDLIWNYATTSPINRSS